MTTKNLGVFLVAAVSVATLITSTAYAKSEDAPTAEETTVVTEPEVVKPLIVRKPLVTKPEFDCNDKLAKILYRAGFRGENLHEAWAIAMRESRGIPTQIGHGSDFGLFQFNYPSHHDKEWWDSEKLLDPLYNAKVAFQMSDGGKDWSQWGLDGQGNTQAYLYRNYGWSEWQIDNWITIPYQKYYEQYPCTK
jgi:hypothetical protein